MDSPGSSDRPQSKKPKYPAHRPLEWTPEIQERIVNAILVGNYVETAAAMAGISKETFYDWLKKGAKKGGIEPYKGFSDAVIKAQADAEARDVMVIEITAHGSPAVYDKHGKKIREEVARTWQAAAWRLERKFPRRWGRFDRHEHTGQDGKPIQVKSVVDLVDHLEKVIAEKQKKKQEAKS